MFIGPVNRIEGQASEAVTATGRVRRVASGELTERVVGIGDEPADDDARERNHDSNEGEHAAPQPQQPRHFDARA